jgi:beta-aspartyl-peptidase (threonine type)
VAKDVAALMEYKGMTLPEAADEVIHKKLVQKGGEGGLIGIDKYGNIVMPFNTSGMYRGYCLPGKKETFIYK